MKYRDYIIAAKKHLDACVSIINRYDSEIPECVLREIHYLSGYVIEGICVYAIYKHYQWEDNKDIREYDADFTRETGLDYYKNGARKDGTNIITTGAHYYITSHGFKQYVELLVVPFQGTNIPYIDASSNIEDIVIDLIKDWKPDLRYRYGTLDRHTTEEIHKLVNACKIIYQKVTQFV